MVLGRRRAGTAATTATGDDRGDDGVVGPDLRGREALEPLRADDGGGRGGGGGGRGGGVGSGDGRTRGGRSEDDGPSAFAPPRSRRRGRPGVVVFSGGTAFNAAAAEMASRDVSRGTAASGAEGGGGRPLDGGSEAASRSNSLGSLADLMLAATGSGEGDGEGAATATAGGGTKVWHVLPVTDDGGSTAEIVRVLGGPAVGDIRSRLLRLAPGTTGEARAVRRLLGHRLVGPSTIRGRGELGARTHEEVGRMAREEWLDLLDGGSEAGRASCGDGDEDGDERRNREHPLWRGVSDPYRSIIRAFLVHFHAQVLQTHNGVRQSPSHPPFDFTGGSVGNFFFAGARTLFRSLPAAIFLFSKVAGIPSGSRVIPAVLSEDRLLLGAQLADGSRIRGQYNISHPKKSPALRHDREPQSTEAPVAANLRERSDGGSDDLRHRQVVKSSLDSLDLSSLHPAPISKVAYLLNDVTWRRQSTKGASSSMQRQQWSDRHEVSPEPNPQVLDAISNANCIVFGCGSLFTSVLPSLVLEGVGPAVARRDAPKVLLLNGWHDSETSWAEPRDGGDPIVSRMDATSFVRAVVDALDQGGANPDAGSGDDNDLPLVTDYITHVFYPIGTEIEIDERALDIFRHSRSPKAQKEPFIRCKAIESIPADTCSEGSRSGGRSRHRIFDPRALVDSLLGLARGEEI
ncbi:hypothetical protein ACHAWF_011820 [Thalassiosira exigua]